MALLPLFSIGGVGMYIKENILALKIMESNYIPIISNHFMLILNPRDVGEGPGGSTQPKYKDLSPDR